MKSETFWSAYKWWIVAAVGLIVVVAGIAVLAAQEPDAKKDNLAPPKTMTPSFNVKDYGAMGDGVTNDEAAILKAVAAARGAIVYFPAGNYLVENTFKAPVGATFKGDADPAKQSYLMVIMPQPDGTVSWKFTWLRP